MAGITVSDVAQGAGRGNRKGGGMKKIRAYIKPDKPHVIRGNQNAVICVLVDYPLIRDEVGRIIVEAINKNTKESA